MNNTKAIDQSQEHFSGNIGKTDENLFLPTDKSPAEKKNPSVPFIPFSHPPIHLTESLEERGCLCPRNFSVMNVLFQMINFNSVRIVNGHPYYAGDTCVLSREGIGKRCGMAGRTAYDALEELKAAGLIIQKRLKNSCSRYHITLYDEALDYLRENPSHPMTETTLPQWSESEIKAIQEKASETADAESASPSDAPLADSASIQEEEKERAPVPTVLGSSTGIAESMPTVETSKDGGGLKSPKAETQEERPEEKAKESLKGDTPELPFSLSDKSSSPSTDPSSAPVQPKKSPPAGDDVDLKVCPPPAALDVVPNGYVEQAIDTLIPSKRMNAAPSVENLEDFMTAFDPDAPAVSTWKHAEVASKLSRHLGELLASAGVSMPPLLFFKKHCVPRMEDLIREGTIQSRPQSLNFFLTAVTGKQLVSDCLSKLRSVDQSAASIERTNQEIRKVTRDAPSDEFKSQVAGMLDSEFGVGWRERL